MNAEFYDILIVIFLFVLGFSLSSYLNENKRIIRVMYISLPFGIGIWALIWIVINILLNLIRVNDNNTVSIITVFLSVVVILFFLFKNRYFLKDRKFLAIFFISLIILSGLTLFFHDLKTTIIFGDSFAYITWSHDIYDLIGRGIPLFGLSISNLSSIVLPDYYNYSLFPMISVCLVLVIFDSIYFYRNKKNKIYLFVFSVLMILLFVSNNNFILQSFYINQHNLTSIYVLIIAIFMIENGVEFSKRQLIFVSLVLFMLTIVRMEGILLAIGTLLFFFYKKGINTTFKRSVTFTYLIFSLLYTMFISIGLWGNELFSAKKYVLLWIIFFLFYIVENQMVKKHPRILDFLQFIVLGVSAIFLALLIVFNSTHMIHSLNVFIANSFNLTFWGITNQTLLVLTIIIVVFKIKCKLLNVKYDSLVNFFVFNIIILLILPNFMPPYHIGWTDSGNRMLFHFIPVLIVWIGIEISRLIDTNQEHSNI